MHMAAYMYTGAYIYIYVCMWRPPSLPSQVLRSYELLLFPASLLVLILSVIALVTGGSIVTAFVDEVLMPLVVKLEALVVCRGYSSCSMAAAVGDAFEQLRRQRGAPPCGGGPRLLVIAQAMMFIGPALIPGTNFNAVLAASNPALGTNHKSFFNDDFMRAALEACWDHLFRAKHHQRSEERKRLGIDVLKLAREQASSTAHDAPHSAPLAQFWRATCSPPGFKTEGI